MGELKLKDTHAPASVRRRRTYIVVHNFKHLLLRNRLPNQSQILYGASLGRGNESLFAASGSHGQDGRHAIAASDLKVSMSRHLIEYMNICEYGRSRSFVDLSPRSCTNKN